MNLLDERASSKLRNGGVAAACWKTTCSSSGFSKGVEAELTTKPGQGLSALMLKSQQTTICWTLCFGGKERRTT